MATRKPVESAGIHRPPRMQRYKRCLYSQRRQYPARSSDVLLSSPTPPQRDAGKKQTSLRFKISRQAHAFSHRTVKANPPSNSKLPPRVGGGRFREDLLWQKTKEQTLLKESPGFCTTAAFGSPHGSTTANRRTIEQSRIWPEIPCSKLQMRALFGGMHGSLSHTCAAACHQRYAARSRKSMTWWIWSLRSPSYPHTPYR